MRIITSPFRFFLDATGLYKTQAQIQQTTSMARSGLRLPYPLNNLGSSFGKIRILSDIQEWWEEIKEEWAYRRMPKDMPLAYQSEASDFSQIHITTGNQRVVLHIGSTTHSSTAEWMIDEQNPKPIVLIFRRVNDSEFNAPFVLNIKGECEAAVDGRTVTKDTPIRHKTKLNINDVEYYIELFAWQALPFAPRFDVGWYTDAGPVRHNNEDAVGIYKSPHGYLFAIADGVGGGESGEFVSEFAIQYLLATFHHNLNGKHNWQDILKKTYENINQEVRRFGMQSQALTGTTLTCVIIKGWNAYIAHIGDSRLYHYNGNAVQQITTDHARQIKRENSTNSQLPQQIERSVLQRAIGKTDTIEPQFTTIRLQPGDGLILTSDAINGKIETEELTQLVRQYRPSKLPEHVAMLANQRFNADNVSVLHIQVQTHAKRTAWNPTSTERVYTGYNRAWSLRLDKPRALNTNYVLRQRRRALLGWLIFFVLIFALIGGLIERNRQASLIDAPSITLQSPTPTLNPTASATRRPPTATATGTATSTLTPTPPPTSTLQSLPTSTLAPVSQG